MSALKRTHITSSTPHRTRVKVSAKRRNPGEMARLATAIEQQPYVTDVQTNLQTGSIIVHHQAQSNAQNKLASTLQDLGVILGAVTDTELPFGSEAAGNSKVATDLTSALADLNNQIGLAANGVIDLRTLVPLGLGALAIRQLLRNGIQFESAPWYVLAYYAFDSFIKLHATATTQPNQNAEK